MLPLALSPSEQEAFDDALLSADRSLRFGARLYNKNGQPLTTQLEMLDGDVVVDATDRRNSPTRVAVCTVIDPEGKLAIDIRDTAPDKIWFSRQVGLTYGVWVPDLDRWVDVPTFRGPISEVSRHGSQVDIDAYGKEAQHLDPHFFPHGFSIAKHVRYDAAIKELFTRRGETEFDLATVHRRLNKSRQWKLGQAPWRAGLGMADDIDKLLFYRGNGALTLKNFPEHPAWRFTKDTSIVGDPEERLSIHDVYNMFVVRGERTVKIKITRSSEIDQKAIVGATSIHVYAAPAKFVDALDAGMEIEIGGRTGDPEVRKISGSYTPGTRTIPLTRALDKAHGVGAPVRVHVKEDRTKRVVGNADLPAGHSLSAESLTGGKRPRIRIDDRPRIHKQENAQKKAEQLRDRVGAGVEIDLAFQAVVIPHLEEFDLVKADAGDIERTLRLKRYNIPHNNNGVMDVNWAGTRKPRRIDRGR